MTSHSLPIPPAHAGPADAAAEHGTAPAGDGGRRRDGFFAHHGAWAPGVRGFRRIGLRASLAIMSLVFAWPIGLLAWSYFQTRLDVLRDAELARTGIHTLRDALLLTQAAQQARAALPLGPAGTAPADAPPAVAAVAEARQRLLQASGPVDAGAQTRDSLQALDEAARALTTAPAGDWAAAWAAHSRHVEAALDLVDRVAEDARLPLDPQPHTSLLARSAVHLLPALIDNTARLRDRARAAAAGQPSALGPAQRVEAHTRQIDLQRRLRRALDQATRLRQELREPLSLQAADRALAALDAQLDGGEPAALAAAAQQAADSLAAAQHQVLTRLEALLEERVHDQRGQRNRVALATVAALLLAAYLFTCFRMVVKGGIDTLVLHMRAMSRGDLSARPRSWGRDELATLINATHDMQSSLRPMLVSIRSAADAIAGGSQEMADGTRNLAQRTDQTATRLERTSASMSQMQQALQQTAEATQEAAHLATQNAQTAERGGAVIGAVVDTMQRIQQSSARIGDIIGTIDSIAFQTNILALNAAVEAARAGEQGKGFAVVASEVRRLAQRSTTAAREIKSLINASVTQTESGAEVVRQAGDTMQEIVSAAQRVNDLLAGIARSTREQSAGIAQVGSDVSTLDELTQQNAALVAETSSAATLMHDHAAQLTAAVARFQL